LIENQTDLIDDNNRSACDDVVAGIEWVISEPGPSNMKVISMSHYGFSGKPDVSTAVAKAIKKGVHFIVSAGNDGKDACATEPSNARGVISVGSINGYNKFPIQGQPDLIGGLNGKVPEGTNVGPCVTIFGPGSFVPTLSTKNINPEYRYFSWGTSISAPQVAAIVANRLSAVGPLSPKEMVNWLIKAGTKGQIEETDMRGSPNLILFSGVGEEIPVSQTAGNRGDGYSVFGNWMKGFGTGTGTKNRRSPEGIS
jgi:serine protease